MLRKNRVWLFGAAWYLIGSAAAVAALIPNGNGNPATAAGQDGGTSTLNPNPALYRISGACPWLTTALAHEFPNLTIDYDSLTGDIKLNTYQAWADVKPAFSVSTGLANPATIGYPKFNAKGLGGALISMTYQPAANSNDPTLAQFHWVQAVQDSNPPAYVTTANAKGFTWGVNVGGGFWDYLDTNKSPTNAAGPFYGAGLGAKSPAQGSAMIDRPGDRFTTAANAQFQTFITKLEGNTLTVYDGVWWGFELTAPISATTPEPATITIWMLLLVGIVVTGKWRSVRGVAA
jgi:hypothetical protein